MYVLFVAAVPTVSLTSSVEKEAACPGEEVTFTCTIEDGTTLDWISEAFSGVPSSFYRFVVGDPVLMLRVYEGFTTTLTREIPDPDMPGFGDLTSTLTFTASTDELNGTVIQCSNTITTRSHVFTALPGIFHACLLHCTG